MIIKGVATNDYKYQKCQMQIEIDEDLHFIVEFDEIDKLTKFRNSKKNIRKPKSPQNKNQRHCCSKSQFKEHVNRYMNTEDKAYIGKVTKEELKIQLKRIVNCIGCRKAAENMFDKLIFKDKNDGENDEKVEIFTEIFANYYEEHLTLSNDILQSESSLYDYLYVYSKDCFEICDSLKTRKNNRCSLHSLDSRANFDTRSKLFARITNKKNYEYDDRYDRQNDHYDNDYKNYRQDESHNEVSHYNNYNFENSVNNSNARPGNLGFFGMTGNATRHQMQKTWWKIWKMLPKCCQSELCCINVDKLYDLVRKYLERHSFCQDCRAQIIRAFYLLCPKNGKSDDKKDKTNSKNHNLPPQNETLILTNRETDSDGEGSCSDSFEFSDDTISGIYFETLNKKKNFDNVRVVKTSKRSKIVGKINRKNFENDSDESSIEMKVEFVQSTIHYKKSGDEGIEDLKIGGDEGYEVRKVDGLNNLDLDKHIRLKIEKTKTTTETDQTDNLPPYEKDKPQIYKNFPPSSSDDQDPPDQHDMNGDYDANFDEDENLDDINTFDPLIYSGIRFCQSSDENHIHVATHDEDIKMLLRKAESEMINHMANGHARHAKSMDQAQNEILVCVGIYIYNRLHKVWHALRICSQTVPLLASICLEAMKEKCVELLDEKMGGFNYEQFALELELEDEPKMSKSGKKREKKKKLKAKRLREKMNKMEEDGNKDEGNIDENNNLVSKVMCEFDENGNDYSKMSTESDISEKIKADKIKNLRIKSISNDQVLKLSSDNSPEWTHVGNKITKTPPMIVKTSKNKENKVPNYEIIENSSDVDSDNDVTKEMKLLQKDIQKKVSRNEIRESIRVKFEDYIWK